VAKTPRSRKTSRSRAVKRTSRKTARAARPTAAAAPTVLSLKRLRRELDLAVSALSRRVDRPGGPSAKVSAAQTVLTRWAAEIDDMCDPDEQELCGPTMDLPLN
jgi:hypothetical protein